ncbi:hypothetical protein CK934_00885 [Chitinophaga sp. MD30]|nr:hypothetical protein CK934_00885 [Chitinophaga sp. MD30]
MQFFLYNIEQIVQYNKYSLILKIKPMKNLEQFSLVSRTEMKTIKGGGKQILAPQCYFFIAIA